MSATGKTLLWAGGGAVLGAAGRFLIAGEWTREAILRHAGYSVFSASATVFGLHWFQLMQSASEITIAAVSAGSLPIVARAVHVAMTGKLNAKVGGFEVNDDGNRTEKK